jgi:hypothetical protein
VIIDAEPGAAATRETPLTNGTDCPSIIYVAFFSPVVSLFILSEFETAEGFFERNAKTTTRPTTITTIIKRATFCFFIRVVYQKKQYIFILSNLLGVWDDIKTLIIDIFIK